MSGRRNVFVFILVLLASVLLPSAAMASKKLYQAKIKDQATRNANRNGSAVMSTFPGRIEFRVSVLNTQNSVGEVWLKHAGNNVVPLCGRPDAAVPDCAYDSFGNLSLEGTITSSLLYIFQVNGADFMNWLDGGTMDISVPYNIPGGASGVSFGTFVQIFP